MKPKSMLESGYTLVIVMVVGTPEIKATAPSLQSLVSLSEQEWEQRLNHLAGQELSGFIALSYLF